MNCQVSRHADLFTAGDGTSNGSGGAGSCRSGQGTDELRSSAAAPAPAASSRTWLWFLVFEAVVALIYFPFGTPSGTPRLLGDVPWMEWPGQVPAWSVLGLSAVAAIAYGARLHRPRTPLAWWFMGSGVFLFVTGDTIYKFWHQVMGQQAIPFPSFIDAIHIAMYPVLAVGLLLLARSRLPGGDHARLLDGLIITVGVALLSWIFLIGPTSPPPRASLSASLHRLTRSGTYSCWPCWRTCGALADCAIRPAVFWPSARSAPLSLTPSTGWQASTPDGTGTTATPSTSAGSCSLAAGGRPPSIPRCATFLNHAGGRCQPQAGPGSPSSVPSR